MLKGEYTSSLQIHAAIPSFIPTPIAYGSYRKTHHNLPNPSFYLSQFLNLDISTPPNPKDLAKHLALLHKTTSSTNSQYGFPVTTFDGGTPHVVDWQPIWSQFFTHLLENVCQQDILTNGPCTQLQLATTHILTRVIPLLLSGLDMKPVLIHGDLWDGNLALNLTNNKPGEIGGEVVLFDASSYYAHNEMELSHFRCEFSTALRDPIYIQEYLKLYPAAEPKEEFDDRNRLYSLKGRLNYSAGHRGELRNS